MVKFLWVLLIALLYTITLSEGLECYHCYTDNTFGDKDATMVRCNEANLTASNTWICPNSKAQCVTEVVEIQTTKAKQTWRTCSNGITDPCDPNALPPGVKMISCTSCGTDRCNMQAVDEPKQAFNININANVNLFIRQ